MRTPWKDWRPVKYLDAPPNYNWDDEEVLYEKNDSWMAGFVVGMFVAFVIFTLLFWLAI